MTIKRWWLPAALVVTLGLAGWTAFAGPSQEQEERAQQEAFERRMGDALIRQGITLYQKGDYAGAIAAWEHYIKGAPPNADTVSIREMIGEARVAAQAPHKNPAKGPGPTMKPRPPRKKPLVTGRTSLQGTGMGRSVGARVMRLVAPVRTVASRLSDRRGKEGSA